MIALSELDDFEANESRILGPSGPVPSPVPSPVPGPAHGHTYLQSSLISLLDSTSDISGDRLALLILLGVICVLLVHTSVKLTQIYSLMLKASQA